MYLTTIRLQCVRWMELQSIQKVSKQKKCYVLCCNLSCITIDIEDIFNKSEDVSISHHIVKNFMQNAQWYGNVSNLYLFRQLATRII